MENGYSLIIYSTCTRLNRETYIKLFNFLKQEPREAFDDRLPNPETLDKLRNAPTLSFGETAEDEPDDIAGDAEAEEEREAEAVQEATARFDEQMAKDAEDAVHNPPPLVQALPALPAPAPEPAAPAAPVASMPAPEGVTSTSHRKQFMQLQRVVQGPRAASFPEISRLFGSGTKADRLKVLRAFVQNGDNLEAVESSFKANRSHSETMVHTRRLMTIREMQAAGFSECLDCVIISIFSCPGGNMSMDQFCQWILAPVSLC